MYIVLETDIIEVTITKLIIIIVSVDKVDNCSVDKIDICSVDKIDNCSVAKFDNCSVDKIDNCSVDKIDNCSVEDIYNCSDDNIDNCCVDKIYNCSVENIYNCSDDKIDNFSVDKIYNCSVDKIDNCSVDKIDNCSVDKIINCSVDKIAVIADSNLMFRVKNDGTVKWDPPGVYTTHCDVDITWFPFDTQTCHVEVGKLVYSTISKLKCYTNLCLSKSFRFSKASMPKYIIKYLWLLKLHNVYYSKPIYINIVNANLFVRIILNKRGLAFYLNIQ